MPWSSLSKLLVGRTIYKSNLTKKLKLNLNLSGRLLFKMQSVTTPNQLAPDTNNYQPIYPIGSTIWLFLAEINEATRQ